MLGVYCVLLACVGYRFCRVVGSMSVFLCDFGILFVFGIFLFLRVYEFSPKENLVVSHEIKITLIIKIAIKSMYNVQKQIAKLRSTDISDILKKENRSSALYFGKENGLYFKYRKRLAQ